MKQLNIYIDGSHLNKQNNGRLGIGGAAVDFNNSSTGKLIDTFSNELTPEYMKSNFGAEKCSNPSAELVALLFALREFKKYIITAEYIVVYADYLGVKEWMLGNWRVKEPYLIKIKSEIDKEIKNLKISNKIDFKWVKGHQSSTNPDAYWNNQVDKLAKGESI